MRPAAWAGCPPSAATPLATTDTPGGTSMWRSTSALSLGVVLQRDPSVRPGRASCRRRRCDGRSRSVRMIRPSRTGSVVANRGLQCIARLPLVRDVHTAGGIDGEGDPGHTPFPHAIGQDPDDPEDGIELDFHRLGGVEPPGGGGDPDDVRAGVTDEDGDIVVQGVVAGPDGVGAGGEWRLQRQQERQEHRSFRGSRKETAGEQAGGSDLHIQRQAGLPDGSDEFTDDLQVHGVLPVAQHRRHVVHFDDQDM